MPLGTDTAGTLPRRVRKPGKPGGNRNRGALRAIPRVIKGKWGPRIRNHPDSPLITCREASASTLSAWQSVTVSLLDEVAVRAAAMRWLDERTDLGTRPVTQAEVASFPFAGGQVPLLMRQQGICKPRQLAAALAIRTTWTPPDGQPPYQDVEGPDGLVRYAYRGEDPGHWDNLALRRAWELALPLVWFVAVAPGSYLARTPSTWSPTSPSCCGSRWPSTRRNGCCPPWTPRTAGVTCGG